jgi:hypothetical protein
MGIFNQKEAEEEDKKDDLFLKGVDQQVSGVLGEVQYITQIIGDNKVAPVENIDGKIKKSIKKIKDLMDPEYEQNPDMAVDAANRSSNDGISLDLEKNPLLNEMGGMPLEDISPEWKELLDTQTLDKAELENLVNKKLKDKVEQANELKNKLKAKNRATNKLQQKSAPKFTPKFQKIQQAMKYIIKEMPPPPAPAPAPRFNPSPFKGQ